jgi:mRNA interferase MazF
VIPARGEIWLVSLGAARPGEPGKNRPAIVISATDLSSDEPDELIVVVPLSSSRAASALRPEIPALKGLDQPSRAICRAVRAVARRRLLRKIAEVPAGKLVEIERALAIVLGLPAPIQ